MNGKNLKSIVFNPGLTDKTFQLIRSIFSFRIEMKTSFEEQKKGQILENYFTFL